MGGKRKFRLFVHRKNEERKKKLHKDATTRTTDAPSTSVAIVSVLPPSNDDAVDSSVQLHQKLITVSLPPQWIITTADPLTLCKMIVCTGKPAKAFVTISIDREMQWIMYYLEHKLSSLNCSMFSVLPFRIDSVSVVQQMMRLIDTSKPCIGNSDDKYIELFEQRKLTLHGVSGPQVCWLDSASSDIPTIRHHNCQLLIPQDNTCERCNICVNYRTTLTTQSQRRQHHNSSHSVESRHINYRYQPLTTIVNRLTGVHKQCCALAKQCGRQKLKIAAAAQTAGITVDNDLHQDLKLIASENSTFINKLPSDSFRRIFWEQQVEAARQKDARTMRWHPLMICWCLYLRHRSSGAYEALRDSGCLHLPSQRTLRDYMYCADTSVGFSFAVDKMLMQAAIVNTSTEREKCVLLLLDEMHIREDLVYDKHSRALFPCCDVSGEMLFDPFWEAVRRIETCGLKVLGATLDGNSINRRLIKLHNPKEEVYKVRNPFTVENRDFFFIPDPPHLIKTVRNCWQSKCRHLWNDGQSISWSHLASLYNRDTASGLGIRMVPKLKL